LSYVDLHAGIIELFDSAAGLSRYKVAFGELPALIRRSERERERQSKEVRREHKKRYTKNANKTVRAMRVAEREAQRLARVTQPWRPPAVTPFPHYRCASCGSTTPTHRCPG
jgi:rubrerythrin